MDKLVPKFKVAIPSKGRLSENSIDLLGSAGYRIRSRRRELSVICPEGPLEVMFARASDIPHLLNTGVVDIGITGRDLVLESGISADEAMACGFGRAELVLAAPKDVTLTQLKKGACRIATSFPRLTEDFCKREGIEATVIEMDGSVELAPKIGIADAIVDLSSTGESLRMNDLNILDTVMETEACIFTKTNIPEDAKVLIHACESVLAAKGKMFLLANAPRDQLSSIRNIVPGLTSPTITSVFGDELMCAIQVVVDQTSIPKVIYELKKLGAEGILVSSLERIIY